ncbi:DUF4333 domain-containing protein [Nocardia sp. NPDC020380]|uniref:DUF4333 domain-containing protein n=1 Tax=Nocardia sp. NPDC020380 TaxID=3364309 RepID=UPI00378AB9C3
MSGPYGPNDAPGTGEGRNDPTQQWGSGQPAPGAGQAPQWGAQPPAEPTTQWGGQQQPPQQPWGQSQPQQPVPGQPWGQSQPQWQQSAPGQEWQQSAPQQQVPGQPWQQSQPQWPQQPGQEGWNPQLSQPGPGQPWPQPQQPASGGGKKKTWLFVGAGVVVLIVIAAVVVGVFALTSKDKLDNSAVQNGVTKVLKDSYGIDDVQNVSCPSGQKVEVDHTFDCTLKVGGEAKKVTIKITKDDGTYEVGRPS